MNWVGSLDITGFLDGAADTIVYDNQMGDPDAADATTKIQGGGIGIYKSKG